MKWTVTQIEGPIGRVLELDGYAAPFGRPRQKGVIREVIKSRAQRRKYPGASGSPTTSSFGVDWEPVELNGRWMTRHLPAGTSANDVADKWTQMVMDERLVRISWGHIVSYTGYIEQLDLDRESENEIAWKLHIQIDRREDTQRRQKVAKPEGLIIDNMEAVQQILVGFGKKQIPLDADLKFDFFDSLNLLVGEVNKVSAGLNSLIAQVGDIERAAFSSVQSFRYGLKAFQTALISASDLIATTQMDAVTFTRGAKSDIAWFNFREDFLAETSVIMATIAEMDRKAELVSTGASTKIVLAQEEDSWESISIRATGGPEAAAAIRRMNGIEAGDRPVAGETYLVP